MPNKKRLQELFFQSAASFIGAAGLTLSLAAIKALSRIIESAIDNIEDGHRLRQANKKLMIAVAQLCDQAHSKGRNQIEELELRARLSTAI